MRVAPILAALGVLVLKLQAAAAYPQFQLTTGSDRCQACHLSPAGGGLLSAFGKDEAGGTISTRGDGRLLHGLWEPPSWLALGGDFRSAAGVKHQAERTRGLAFPMQADLYANLSFGSWSFNLIAGLRGATRTPRPDLIYRLGSREHYLMYQREAGEGLVLRAGRFFPVFGLRSQDHTAYVRRYLGQHTLEEPYGVAAGYLGESWEAHLSLFVPQPVPLLGAGPPAKGVAAYYERRLHDDRAAVAAQAKLAVTDEDTRLTLGGVGKLWLEGPGLLLLGELNVQRQSFEVGEPRLQIASYLGATRVLLPGWMVTAAIQQWEPDLTLRSSTRSATELNLQWFPIAHLELHLLGRLEAVGNNYDDPGLLTLLQVHYFL
ncbi:MAG: hypothetical protein R3B48_18830 [Kofleriaceae bacterium]